MLKNNKNHQSGGFVQLIILIVVALFLMNYYGVTLNDVLNWFKVAIHNVL